MARLKVLSALDTAKTQYYHFKAIMIAGMGLFTDAYDLFSITLITKMIGRIHYSRRGNETPPEVTSPLVAVALLGTAIGQVVFGRLGDLKGRRRVYGLALVLMVFGSLACGFSICRKRSCVLVSLGFFRFVLGLGIGGDYPLSATIMSEFANKRTRGSFIAAVFSMQGFGILACSTVTVVVCAIFRRASASVDDADVAWRLILMLGSVPAAMTYYWRMLMPETARYTALVEQNVIQAAKDMERVLDVELSQIAEEHPLPPTAHPYTLLSREFLRRHGRDLFACSSTWFLLDIVFYSQVLFQSQIYNIYLKKDKNYDVYQEAIHVAWIQAVIAVCSTIPGYFFSVYFIDKWGRVKIQIMGFFFMALAFFAIGIPYYFYWTEGDHDDRHNGFMVLYGLAFFFANFGPNTTTFIVPAELFPARFRSTCHGISGAIGKIGAIIGSVGFLWASHKKGDGEGYRNGIGMTASLIILGGVCIAGMVVTYFFTRETMGISLEENEVESEAHEVQEYHNL
ncbi:hypothetical protein Fmac_005967 [Flemingia macrophylla]|uniref:Major facilitator superfamily (MFS) profile domain-containing protein n=1 Tax=Flemingia macrophylla TaxID=520843 RepID=A0ABD1N9B8_9FABA